MLPCHIFTGDFWPSDYAAIVTPSGPIKAIFEFIHIWRMPVFFMLSGFLSALVINRRSTAYWANQRFKRVGLPLLIFWIPIALVLPQIFGYGFKGVLPGSNAVNAEIFFSPNHLWFLIHLMLFVGIVGINRLVSSVASTIFRLRVFKASWAMFTGFFVRVIYLPVPLAIIVILFFFLIPTGGELIENLPATSIYFFLGYGLFSNKSLFKRMKSHWAYYVVFVLIAFAVYLWLTSQLGAYDPKNEEDAPLWALVVGLKAICAILFSYGFIGLSETKFGLRQPYMALALGLCILDLPDTPSGRHCDHVRDVWYFDSRRAQVPGRNCSDFFDWNSDLQISCARDSYRCSSERQAV